MTPITNSDGKLIVVNADSMEYPIFRKHMSLRHPDSIGGIESLPDALDEYVEECWRAFHDTVHRLSLYGAMGHEHGV